MNEGSNFDLGSLGENFSDLGSDFCWREVSTAERQALNFFLQQVRLHHGFVLNKFLQKFRATSPGLQTCDKLINDLQLLDESLVVSLVLQTNNTVIKKGR